MGRYQEQVARRDARYEYEIPDGALHCEIVTGTETTETEGLDGRILHGVQTWRGVRYLLRLDPPEPFELSPAQLADRAETRRALVECADDFATVIGEALMHARMALIALDFMDITDRAEPWAKLVEARGVLAALCGMLVEAGAIDPMDH